MTPAELLVFTEQFYKRNIDIMRKKNADYSGGSEDPFANFTALSRAIGEDDFVTMIGFLTRMMDKFMRIASFVKNKTLLVEDESVSDTLADLANYCALLAAYIESRKKLSRPDNVLS